MSKHENKNNSVTEELLSEMHRNVTMGSESLSTVTPKIKDKFLLSNVTSQLEKYAEFTNKTESLMEKHSIKAKQPSLMKKLMTRGGIILNTAVDSSESHIAEMIERGTKLGAKQLEHKLCEFETKGAERDAVELCKSIVDFERTESDKMKDYM
ncbi:MAG: hypothetical protein E7628_08335 [Ruminococcaceae bacterium]|nr:hypothetical protein [Oscillospiraceae bacterium]